MVSNEKLLHRQLDQRLSGVGGLTWLPWIGIRYPSRPDSQRLLIVGESHYSNERDSAKAASAIQETSTRVDYTRAVISECCINEEWPNRTLEALPKLIFRTDAIHSHELWADVAFYNFVQRPMHYVPGSQERPSFEDFAAGWRVFSGVVDILRPSCCLFVGVEASHSFFYVMGAACGGAQRTEKVGSTYGRLAHVECGGRRIPLHFVKHAGRYFSWQRWHDYLRARSPEIDAMASDLIYRA